MGAQAMRGQTEWGTIQWGHADGGTIAALPEQIPEEEIGENLGPDGFREPARSMHAEATAAFIGSLLLLLLGQCFRSRHLPLRSAAWLLLGVALGVSSGLCTAAPPARDGSAAVVLATGLGITGGIGAALFPDAGRFVLGAGTAGAFVGKYCAPFVEWALEGLVVSSWPSALLVATATLAGALAALRFEPWAILGLSAFGGAYGVALSLHWWAKRSWLVLRQVPQADAYDSFGRHCWRLRLGCREVGAVEMLWFVVLWANLTILGAACQSVLFQKDCIAGICNKAWTKHYNVLRRVASSSAFNPTAEGAVLRPMQPMPPVPPEAATYGCTLDELPDLVHDQESPVHQGRRSPGSSREEPIAEAELSSSEPLL